MFVVEPHESPGLRVKQHIFYRKRYPQPEEQDAFAFTSGVRPYASSTIANCSTKPQVGDTAGVYPGGFASLENAACPSGIYGLSMTLRLFQFIAHDGAVIVCPAPMLL
jgi:hypothetical protein